MTKTQLLRAARYLNDDAQTDLRSHANKLDGGGYEWPDDPPGYGYGSAYKKIYEEKLSLAKALRAMAGKVKK